MTDEYIAELVKRLQWANKYKMFREAAAVILMLQERLRIAENVTENSKRAHEIMVGRKGE